MSMTMPRSEEHTSELQSRVDLVCRLLLEKIKESDAWSVKAYVVIEGDMIPKIEDCIRALSSKRRAHIVDGRLPLSTIQSFFFFNDTATTEIYTLSLHDALPI